MRLLALVLVALPGAVSAGDAADGRCRILAEAHGENIQAVTDQADGKPLVIPVLLHCEHLDGGDARVRIERVEVEYRVDGQPTAQVPRARRQSLRGTCDDTIPLQVTLLAPDQKRRAPIRGLDGPIALDATLTFHGRDRSAKPRRCFGTMQWTFTVEPGTR